MIRYLAVPISPPGEAVVAYRGHGLDGQRVRVVAAVARHLVGERAPLDLAPGYSVIDASGTRFFMPAANLRRPAKAKHSKAAAKKTREENR